MSLASVGTCGEFSSGEDPPVCQGWGWAGKAPWLRSEVGRQRRRYLSSSFKPLTHTHTCCGTDSDQTARAFCIAVTEESPEHSVVIYRGHFS